MCAPAGAQRRRKRLFSGHLHGFFLHSFKSQARERIVDTYRSVGLGTAHAAGKDDRIVVALSRQRKIRLDPPSPRMGHTQIRRANVWVRQQMGKIWHSQRDSSHLLGGFFQANVGQEHHISAACDGGGALQASQRDIDLRQHFRGK